MVYIYIYSGIERLLSDEVSLCADENLKYIRKILKKRNSYYFYHVCWFFPKLKLKLEICVRIYIWKELE